MRIPGFEAAGEGLIGQYGIKEDWKFRCRYRMAFGRNGRVEIGQRLVVAEVMDFSEAGRQKVEDPCSVLFERFEALAPCLSILRLHPFDQDLFGPAGRVG